MLAFLGLHPWPSLEVPAPGQPPGGVRDLRETNGIGPPAFCSHAVLPQLLRARRRPQRLGRTSLRAIEAGARIPSWRQLEAIGAAFEAHAVPVGFEFLDAAFFRAAPIATAMAWAPDIAAARALVVTGAQYERAEPLLDRLLGPARAVRNLPSLRELAQRARVPDAAAGPRVDRARARLEVYDRLARELNDGNRHAGAPETAP